MNKKNKIVIAITSVLAAGALITAGAFAFFTDRAKTEGEAKIGGVEIAPINIMVGNASVTKNIDSEFISTYEYYRFNGSLYDQPSLEGYWGEQGIGYTPRWIYQAEKQAVELNYFRTSDGEVAYCMDFGKHSPSSGAANEETVVSEAANRVLASGYPNKKASDYQGQYPGLRDIELEWATQVALKIVEGTGYVSDSSTHTTVQNNALAIKLTDFDINRGTSSRIIPISEARTAEAQKMYNLVNYLVSQANGSIVTSRFNMSIDNVKTLKTDGGYLVGPYEVTSTFTDPATLTASNSSAAFKDTAGNTITTIAGSGQFYVFVPESATEQVNISVSIPGKSIPASYYYWTGSDDEQKMLVSKTIPVKAESTITTTYDVNLSNWNPGDISTIKWEVENIQNKSIDTRNTIYLYWEGADITRNPVYLYTDQTTNISIFNDIKNGNPSANIALGQVKTFTINGQQYQGYTFTIGGDTLDGVGNSAETGDSKEVDYASTMDDSSTTKDTLAFKLALSPTCSYESMKKNFKVVVVTEAKQYRNTQDGANGGWSVVGTAEVKF